MEPPPPPMREAPPTQMRGVPPPPPPPITSSAFLVNSTISQDRTLGLSALEESNLKSLEKNMEALSVMSNQKNNHQRNIYPVQPHPVEQPVILDLTREPRRRRGSNSSYTQLSASNRSRSRGSGSDSNPPRRRSKRKARVKADMNSKKRLREELEDEARLGPAPQSEFESNTEWVDADGSEMPSFDPSKSKDETNSEVFYTPKSFSHRDCHC
jgi:hypothetical protein